MVTVSNIQIPNVQPELSGPLRLLEKHISQNQTGIENWFRCQWRKTPPLITSSVDLRNAGFKIAPIDTNLFPAGYNNLNRDFLPLSIQAAQAALENACPNTTSILIIPENHTRNYFYFESIANLQEIMQKAGFITHIGTLNPEITEAKSFDLKSGRTITLNPITRVKNKIQIDGFQPCLILLNNDLSDGIPEILQNLDQKIRPPLHLGWSKRLKSTHFSYYDDVVNEFAELIDIDPWLINPLFRNCGEVNFNAIDGEECLVKNVELLLQQIKRKYEQYDINQKPFVVVKADAGTYGMGVMMVDDAEQLLRLNRKQRSTMSTSKGKQHVTKVIMQEGVFTFETWGENHASAEPVVYMLGQHVIGGFYRVHAKRSSNENLNSPGAHFEPLAFAECCNNPKRCEQDNSSQNRFYTYGVIARLALAAAARELKAIENES